MALKRVLDRVFGYIVQDSTTNRYLNDLRALLHELQDYVNKLIGVRTDTTLVGRRPQLNFMEGANITLTVEDSDADDEIQVTIAAPNPSGATLADGDYGDVTVSGGGTSIQIDASAVGTTEIANDAVTFAKMQNVSEGTIIGRLIGSGTGDPITMGIGQGLDNTGGDLEIPANAIATAMIGDDQVTYAKMQNISTTQRALGRDTSGAGDTEEVTVTQILDWTA